jgi:hypothetical protein
MKDETSHLDVVSINVVAVVTKPTKSLLVIKQLHPMPETIHPYNPQTQAPLMPGKEKMGINFVVQSTFEYICDETRRMNLSTP